MPITQQEIVVQDLSPTVVKAARDLASAIAESEVFRQFEEAHERFRGDSKLQQQLRDHQARQQQARLARMWNGGDSSEADELERQWDLLLENRVMERYLACEEQLRNLLRDAAGRITNKVGIDYGAACAPAGGCC